MQAKSKLIPNSILFNFIVVIILILISRYTSLKSEEMLNLVAGILIGGIFNTIFEGIMVFNWAYKLRYFMKGFEGGFLFLFISLSFLIIGTRVISADRMVLMAAYGACLGLIWGLLDFLITENRIRKAPYSGNEKPILIYKASISDFGQLYGRGIILLLPDRILFLGENVKNREVMLSDIENMNVQSSILFPFKLDLLLEDSVISINVSMPYLWKKKIEETMSS